MNAFKIKQKLLVVAILTVIVASGCNRTEESPDSAAAIREQISQYRGQINELTIKANKLERQLIEMGEADAIRNRIPVSVREVGREVFVNRFKVSGTAEAVNNAIISPETSGNLAEILVSKGDAVRKGQVLARLSTNVIERNIEEIKTSLELAETVYERQKRLWSQEIGSEIQYLEAKNSVQSLQKRMQTLESQKDMAVMRSPIDGFVDETFVKRGELVMPGSPVMEIVNLEDMYINAEVSEAYLSYVEPGEMVTLRFPAWPGFEMEVPVHRVGHVINPENRTFRMQLKISNQQDRFKPNMMANVSIKSHYIEEAIVVPTMLIGFDTQGHYVFTVTERDGLPVARKSYLERGAEAEGKTLIKAGLNEGDLLISKGHHRLSEGDAIRIIQE